MQADDLVRMLFSTEETELPPEPVAEQPTPGPTDAAAQVPTVGKDEL